MWSEEIELNWSLSDEADTLEDVGLDEIELSRLTYLAEHPELMDPIIWFLPNNQWKTTEGMR